MRRFIAAGFAAGLAALALVAFAPSGINPANAFHGVFLAHVHDDYFHPTGSFVPGPGHVAAQALCQSGTPDATCTSKIHTGDSVRWVAPAPLAVNPHTVTECTSATYSVCGAGSTAGPIEDSGVLFQPGWPYQVQFNTPGTYYYRCDVHPSVMRGIVQVTNFAAGGDVEVFTAADTDNQAFPYLLAAFGAGLVVLATLGAYTRRRLARAESTIE